MPTHCPNFKDGYDETTILYKPSTKKTGKRSQRVADFF